MIWIIEADLGACCTGFPSVAENRYRMGVHADIWMEMVNNIFF